MRNLKKLLAVIVAICVLATLPVSAFAADTTLAADTKTCADIGMLVGQSTSTGVTAEYGATTPTRINAAIMLLRLKGVLAEAQAFTGTENFADASKAAWAKPLMAYLKANPALGFDGVGENNFAPNEPITAQMYYKVLLTGLGYSIPADYAYADTLTFAKDTVKLAMVGNVTDFTVDDLATATVEALKGAVKGGTKTLAATLVDAGKIDKAAAIAAGLYSDVLSATVAQTGAKVITVTFNRALTADEKTAATISVKNGLVSYTVTPKWAADNSSVVLAYAYNYFAGDYTVKIGGIADPIAVKVVDEKVTKIAINNDYLPKSTTAALDYTVSNQFDEKMDNQTLSISAYNATKGISYTVASDIVDLSAADKDNVIILTISHYATGISVSKSVPVSDIASAKTIALDTVLPLSGKTRISETETGLILPYTFTDQYGKVLKLPATTAANTDANPASETIGGIRFMTSDPAIVTPDTFAVNSDGVLTFTATGDGTVIISAIAPSTGAVGTVTIKIEAAAAVKTFSVSNPGVLVALGDSVVVPYTAVDTFGTPIATADFGATQKASVSIVSSNPSVVTGSSISWNGKNELVITPVGSGAVTIYPTVGGVLQNSITLDVKALAVPTRIMGLKDVPSLFQVGATTTIDASKLNVIDQYNRPIDVKNYGDVYNVTVAIDGAYAAHVSLTPAPATITSASGSTTLAGVAAGSENLIFSLNKNGTAISTYKATFKTIADADITGYSIDTIGTLYGVSGNNTSSAHAVVPKLLGKDASGNSVTINQAIITAVTSSNTSVVDVNLTAKNAWALKAGTSTVAIWKGGTKLAETTVTAKDETPYAATATFDATSYTVRSTGTTATITLTVKDQYGVAIASPAGVWNLSNGNVSRTGNVVTGVTVGTTTVSFVTNTGIVVTAEVVIN